MVRCTYKKIMRYGWRRSWKVEYLKYKSMNDNADNMSKVERKLIEKF